MGSINMADLSNSVLRRDVEDILKDADLSQLSSKKVRKQLEAKHGADMTNRKKDIDSMVMDFINRKEEEEKEDEKEKEFLSSASESDFDEPEDTSPVRKKVKKQDADADLAEMLQA